MGVGVGNPCDTSGPGGRAGCTGGGALLEVQDVDIFVSIFEFPLEVPGAKSSP